MSPLDKLDAVANRLVQIAGTAHGRDRIVLKEAAATIRGSCATIRTTLEGDARRPRHPKFALIADDEAPPLAGGDQNP